MKKIVLQFDEMTNNVYDINGGFIVCWGGLQYEELPESKQGSTGIDGEQAIRMMKIAAHVQNPAEIKDI